MTLNAIHTRLREVLDIHLDPEWGSTYWLDRQKHLGFSIRDEIKDVRDLSRLGLTQPSDLNSRPLLDFIPKRFHDSLSEFVLGQTGGTTGRPIWTAYSQEEFEEAFITPFVLAARYVGFPTQGLWLFVGPSGPHIIGQAARRLAKITGNLEPFTVDFDPRWAKKISSGSFASERYLNHVIEQAMAIIEHQPIRVLFTTPTVLAKLAPAMTTQQRLRIAGAHYGGQPITRQQINDFKSSYFPNAIHLAGYGNTLWGCCLELDLSSPQMAYYPYGNRLLFSIENSSKVEDVQKERQAGRLMFSRLDRSMLLVNFLESDRAELRHEVSSSASDFGPPAIIDPHRVESKITSSPGLY